jgi:LPXTG-site transpeptidase (sortase) family protein
MKHNMIVLGVAGLLALLAMCAATVIMLNITGSLLARPEKPRPVRIALAPPLTAPTAAPSPRAVEAPPGLVAAASKQPLATPAPATATPSPTATSNSSVVPIPTMSFSLATPPSLVATRLVIPKLGLDAPVLVAPLINETWQVDHLGQAVGHLEGTASPGSNSNMVLAGHVTLAEGVYGPFAGLGKLVPGDLLIVYKGEEEFYYAIDGYQRVDRSAVEVTYPTTTGQITLITCTNWNSEQNRYVERLIVKGHLIKS